MDYSEIYNVCQPVIDWLKEHYPHNHKLVIGTSGAELIETGKLTVLDKELMEQINIPNVPKVDIKNIFKEK